jgi:hypothetical protein
MSDALLFGDGIVRLRPDEMPFLYLAMVIVYVYVAYRSAKAYRQGRRERPKAAEPPRKSEE